MQSMVAWIDEEASPLRPRDRPLMLPSLDEAIDVADLQPDARLALPAVVGALEQTIEEAPLHGHAVIGVEMRPMLEPMHFQPLLAGRGAREAFALTSRMQPLAAPVRGREEWDRDFVPTRRA